MNKFCKKNLPWILLGLIVIFGFFLRVWQLGEPSMWFDESISALNARNILEKGVPVFDSGAFYGGYFVFHYLMAFFIFLFKGDFGARLISVLFGLGTIILAFFIGKEFDRSEKKGRKSEGNKYVTGIIAALLSAVMYFEIIYSREARFYQMFQFMFFLTIFLLYKSKENKKYAYLACLSLIILLDTHMEGIVLIPFFIYLFWKEHKDWRLFIIPILAGLWFGRGILYLPFVSGGSGISSVNIDSYSSALFAKLGAFFFVSLIGIPFAIKKNLRMFLLVGLPSIIILLGLIFIKTFAIRYAYFSILAVIILMSVLISFVYKNSKILFVLLLTFILIYPSNLVYNEGYFTVIKPQEIGSKSASEPVIDYKNLNSETREIILNSKIVVLSTPGMEWYLKRPDYAVPFSLNGLSNGFAIFNGKDIYTGAELFDLDSPQINNFVLVEDLFGYSKLKTEERNKLDGIKEKCTIVQQTNYLKVFNCTL